MPGFDAALLGREQGESLTLMVPAADAFGVRDESALYDMLMAHFITDAGMRPVVGSQINGSNPDGTPFVALVVEVADDYARGEPNHPLAGIDVTWDITIVEAVVAGSAFLTRFPSAFRYSGSLSALRSAHSAPIGGG